MISKSPDPQCNFSDPRIPHPLRVPRSSITVEGISLTVASIIGNEVEIAIIPHTHSATSLHSLAPGAALNIEVDVLGKYAERQQQKQETFTLTEEYLIANGY